MTKSKSSPRDRVRFSLRWKITLPFIFLALILSFGAAFLVNQLLNQTEELQFLRQLADSGKQATDAIVRVESDLLEVERLIANTEGVIQGVGLQDAEDLRARILPLIINSGADFSVVVDNSATSLLTIRHNPGGLAGDYEVLRGETFYADWPFVLQVLDAEIDQIGDKWVGIEEIAVNERVLSVFTIAGPLRDNQGQVLGAVLVGTYVDELVTDLSLRAGANVGMYRAGTGALLGTSLEPELNDDIRLDSSELSSAMAPGDTQNLVRNISVAGSEYAEVLTKLQARQGTVDLGVIGISLLRSPEQNALRANVFTVVRYGVISLVSVVTIGLLISNMITRPLVEIAKASSEVAEGNLNTFVSTSANDEIGVLARSFNHLVAGLRESLPYRDAVMPVLQPEALAEMQSQSADDTLKSEGYAGEATVLAADVSSFTRGLDIADPKYVLASLNDYFEAMVPTITQHGGVVSQFDGETLIAYFGLSPKQLPPSVSAMQGVHAGLELIQLIDQWNSDRAVKGTPALEIWIGISTGSVIAGRIGDTSQLPLKVIGTTVQEARDVQDVCRELGEGALLISETSYEFLTEVRGQFKFGRYGQTRLRHSGDEIKVYEVRGRRTSFVRSGRGSGDHWTGENG